MSEREREIERDVTHKYKTKVFFSTCSYGLFEKKISANVTLTFFLGMTKYKVVVTGSISTK